MFFFFSRYAPNENQIFNENRGKKIWISAEYFERLSYILKENFFFSVAFLKANSPVFIAVWRRSTPESTADRVSLLGTLLHGKVSFDASLPAH